MAVAKRAWVGALGGEEQFGRRLEWAGISEAAVAWAAEGGGCEPESMASWQVVLRDAASHLADGVDPPEDVLRHHPFAEFPWAFAKAGAESAGLSIADDGLLRALVGNVAARLLAVAGRALYTEFDKLRSKADGSGFSYDHWLRELEGGLAVSIFTGYPVLARACA